MLLKDIINRAISILGLESEVSVDIPSQTLSRLVESANMVLDELSEEYIHLKNVETKQFADNRIYYSSFSKSIREVLSVTQNGRKLHFTMYPLYVLSDEAVDGDAEIKYIYYLGTHNLNDTVLLPPKYSVYTLALGVVSEYLYRIGQIDEALFYKNRYIGTLKNLSERLRSATIKSRW